MSKCYFDFQTAQRKTQIMKKKTVSANNEISSKKTNFDEIKKIIEEEIFEPVKELALATNGDFAFSIEEVYLGKTGTLRNCNITTEVNSYNCKISFNCEADLETAKDVKIKGMKIHLNSVFSKNSFINFIEKYSKALLKYFTMLRK